MAEPDRRAQLPPLDQIHDEEFVLSLSALDVRRVLNLLASTAAKRQRAIERKEARGQGFVPEPGHRHVGKQQVAELTGTFDRLYARTYGAHKLTE